MIRPDPGLRRSLQENVARIQKVCPRLKNLDSRSHDSISWYLLECVLFQDLSADALDQLMNTIRECIGQRLFLLPLVKKEELHLMLENDNLRDWSLREAFPGIVWSVVRYIRRHRKFTDYILQTAHEQIIEHMKQEIFYIGSSSAYPGKCNRFFLGLAARAIKPLPKKPQEFYGYAENHLWHWLQRTGAIGHSKFKSLSKIQKHTLAWKYSLECDPQSPELFFLQFELYRVCASEKDTQKKFLCQNSKSGCEHCPLALRCLKPDYH